MPTLSLLAGKVQDHGNKVNRGTGYEILKPSKARTMLSQSMLN